MRLQELLENSVKREAVTTSQQLTSDLRRACAAAKWPVEVINVIELREEDDGYLIFYPEPVQDKVHVLEYGDQDTQPSGILRSFLRDCLSQVGGKQ